jgi:hypothetical protein
VAPPPVAPAKPAVEQAPPASTTAKVEPQPPEAKPQPVIPSRIASFKVFYMTKGRAALQLKDGDTLTQADRYYVVLSMNENAYTYVAQIDSSDSINPIFPNTQFSAKANPLAPRSEIRFPEREFFLLDANQGKEALYIISCESPDHRLDAIYKEAQTADQARAKQLTEEFLQIFQRMDPSNAKTIWFHHG